MDTQKGVAVMGKGEDARCENRTKPSGQTAQRSDRARRTAAACTTKYPRMTKTKSLPQNKSPRKDPLTLPSDASQYIFPPPPPCRFFLTTTPTLKTRVRFLENPPPIEEKDGDDGAYIHSKPGLLLSPQTLATARPADTTATRYLAHGQDTPPSASPPPFWRMLICFGPMRTPITLSNADEHTIATVMEQCRYLEGRGNVLYLEYYPNMYIRLGSDEKLEMAAEIVAGYHEATKAYMREDVWSDGNNHLRFIGSELYGALDDPVTSRSSAGSITPPSGGSVDASGYESDDGAARAGTRGAWRHPDKELLHAVWDRHPKSPGCSNHAVDAGRKALNPIAPPPTEKDLIAPWVWETLHSPVPETGMEKVINSMQRHGFGGFGGTVETEVEKDSVGGLGGV